MMDSTTRTRKQSGQILILGTLMAMVLCGMVGLALDTGFFYFQKRRIQTAADAAAIAAVLEAAKGASADYVTAGINDATLNGYKNGSAGVVTSINRPPTSGPHAGNSAYVEAIVSKPVNSFFLGILNLNSITVIAKAEAKMGAGPNCVYLLDPAVEGALLVAGTFQASCGVITNSSSSKSLSLNSGSATASSFSTYGNYIGGFSPVPVTGVPRVADPLAYLQPPAFPANNYYGTVVTNSTPLNPGVYHGGIHVMQGVQAVFNPGTYILNGGGLVTEGGPNAGMSGTGVTFYFTANQPVPNPPGGFNMGSTQTAGPFLMNGEGAVNFTAPTSGPMSGILFFQDRNPANQTTQPYDIQGTNTSSIQGILYIPNANLLYQNHTVNTAAYTIIISKTLHLDGSGPSLVINNDYSSLANGSPLRVQAVLTR